MFRAGSAAKARRRSDALGLGLGWLCGGALALNLFFVVGLLVLLAVNGLGAFWPRDLVLLELRDGSRLLGEVHRREPMRKQTGELSTSPEETRIQLEVGNRDLFGIDFVWVDEPAIARRSLPDGAVLLERLEGGSFLGTLVELRRGDEVVAASPEATWSALEALLPRKEDERRAIRGIEKGEIGDVNYELEEIRLERRRRALDGASEPSEDLDARERAAHARYESLAARLLGLREGLARETVVVEVADGRRKTIAAGEIVRMLRPNAMGAGARLGLFASRVWEFLADDPRESNTEGGIFPAIFGTVLMVFLMSIAVVPLGVLAALYLREYARQGLAVRIVRIAVNNLAGVPSIVFGVFGLGFFVYGVGGTIDRLFFAQALPTPTFGTGGILWASLTLALLTVPVVIVAAEEGLAAVPRIVREGSLALGATKLETTWRVVIPAAAPGILTGLILAMARAAGEVAPLMIVGMVKLAPALPVDHHPPFVHLERKFMHLGFHVYDIGFQSPNIDATKPLVFATALLLIAVVTTMNLLAISLRNHLRRKYAGSAL